MDKSPEAFRTISEVAESLETPAHVLRFWESRFPQIRPVKRAGGRRYYRPADVALLSGIRHLLHDEGMTIRGVQKILREQGVRHVAALAGGAEAMDFDADVLEGADIVPVMAPEEPATAQLFELDTTPRAAVPVEEATGEVVRLHAGRSEAEPAMARTAEVPETVDSLPAELPPLVAGEEVPEAGHVWVDDEPELGLGTGSVSPTDLFAPPPVAKAQDAIPEITEAGESPVMMSGLAARIRALPRPLSAAALPELEELHSRLGLFHAQMAEALRQRR